MINCKIIKSTPFGRVGVIWNEINCNPVITRILIPKPGCSAVVQLSKRYRYWQEYSCAQIDSIAYAIVAYLEGEKIEFSLDIVDLSLCTEFQRSVLRAGHRIPRGGVSTYRLIAQYIGKRNAARAVGNALANNPFPLIVPCHRAVRSDLHLGGYQGGVEMKRDLLEREGISFDDSGRVSSKQCYYD